MDINNEVNKNKIISEDDLFMSEDDSENEWSSQDFIQAVNAAEADDDDSEEDDWDNDINELNEVEAEKVKKESTEKAAESAKADDDEEKNKSLLVLLDQELKDDFENEWSTQAEADDDNSKEDDWDDYINERGWNEVEAEKVKKESTETKVEESVNKRKKKPSISPVTKKKQKLENEPQKEAGKKKSRRMPCRKCPRCLAPKCRECKMCLNPKFKKPCINRTCFSKLEPKKDEDKEKAAEEKLALLDIELKDDKEDNESDPDTSILDEIDEKNDEKAKNDVKKSQLAEEDNDPDGWGEYINQIIKGKKHREIDEENDEQTKENFNEKPKNEASTSTGRKNHDGIPTGRQKVPYLLSDLCKPKNPITSKGMKKPFKGVAIC